MAPRNPPKPRRVVAETRAVQRLERDWQRTGGVVTYGAVLAELPAWMRDQFPAPTPDRRVPAYIPLDHW